MGSPISPPCGTSTQTLCLLALSYTQNCASDLLNADFPLPNWWLCLILCLRSTKFCITSSSIPCRALHLALDTMLLMPQFLLLLECHLYSIIPHHLQLLLKVVTSPLPKWIMTHPSKKSKEKGILIKNVCKTTVATGKQIPTSVCCTKMCLSFIMSSFFCSCYKDHWQHTTAEKKDLLD